MSSLLAPSDDVFPGFPYIATRVVPAMLHLMVLPSEWSEFELQEFARRQTLANRLAACLALGAGRAIYFDAEDASAAAATRLPGADAVVAGLLVPAADFPDSPDLSARRAALNALAERVRRRGGFMLGDITCGARPATDDEVGRLAGVQPDGVPAGLERCARCGQPRGVCLGDRTEFPRPLLTVHCTCDNHNRCARCGSQLADHRLNANYFDPRTRRVVHVPGFCGLSHRCGDERRTK